ncbi:MAG: hypothetical protein KDB80_13175 [Planctomycetes bacterium]|nr:hypothetical protein [Planctomycetota bacterium]
MTEQELKDEVRLLASRYVDEELDDREVVKFEARLAAEPKLREFVAELRDDRAWFAAGKAEAPPTPSEGFKARVLRDVHRLPRAEELSDEQAPAQTMAFEVACRRIMVAAALLIGIGLLVFGGLLHTADSGKLDASPAEIQRKMEELDAVILERAFGDRR